MKHLNFIGKFNPASDQNKITLTKKDNVKLTHLHKIIIASVDSNGDTIEDIIRDSAIKHACKALSIICGGYTHYNGTGGWLDDNNTLIEESVTIIEAYSAELDTNSGVPIYDALVGLAQYILTLLEQDSVAIVYDGELHLIER